MNKAFLKNCVFLSDENFDFLLLKLSRRAISSFYDCMLSNSWKYFATFTFLDEDVRSNFESCSVAWKRFINNLKNKYPNTKAIAICEEFEKGGYYLHALLSDVDLTLQPTMFWQRQIFSCDDWDLGFNTVVVLNSERKASQIMSYMAKYLESGVSKH